MRTLTAKEKKDKKARCQKLRHQEKGAAIRAKYGPSGKSAPVTVMNLDDHTVVVEVNPSVFKKRYNSDWVESRAHDLGFGSYAVYLQSPHWLELRRRVLERDEGHCCRCRRTTKLSVHHRTYIRLGSELLADLMTLCKNCHWAIHRKT